MKQCHQATTSTTTRMAVNGDFLNCFVAIFNCLVKHAWVCVMTVFPTTQTCCLIAVRSTVNQLFSTFPINDSRNTIKRCLQLSQECVVSIYKCCIVAHAHVSNIIRLFNNYTWISMMLSSSMLTEQWVFLMISWTFNTFKLICTLLNYKQTNLCKFYLPSININCQTLTFWNDSNWSCINWK